MAQAGNQDAAALRKEHDELAGRLGRRPSVDVARVGIFWSVGGVMLLAIGWALLWDRWAKEPSDLARAHPEWFVTAAGVFAVLSLPLLVRVFLVLRRSRRLAAEERVLFARMLELRRALELDA